VKIDEKFKRHPLKGIMKGFESIHLKGDWLLIFKVDDEFLSLVMGSVINSVSTPNFSQYYSKSK
jgi:addiction module RelE/StbE family toxin